MVPAGHAHTDVWPAALLSVNSIPSASVFCFPPMGQQGLTMLSVFVSAVHPRVTHAGAFVVPSVTLIQKTSVDPTLKLACDEQPLPKTLNSASRQPWSRRRTLSWFTVQMSAPVDVNLTVSPLEAAVPVKSIDWRFAIVWLVTLVAALLR